MWTRESEDIILPKALGKAWGSKTPLRNLTRVVSLEDPKGPQCRDERDGEACVWGWGGGLRMVCRRSRNFLFDRKYGTHLNAYQAASVLPFQLSFFSKGVLSVSQAKTLGPQWGQWEERRDGTLPEEVGRAIGRKRGPQRPFLTLPGGVAPAFFPNCLEGW